MLKSTRAFLFMGGITRKLQRKIVRNRWTQSDERNSISSKGKNWRRAGGGRALERGRNPALGPRGVQPAHAAIASSFGAEDVALIDIAARVRPDIEFSLSIRDFLFAETYELIEQLKRNTEFALNE